MRETRLLTSLATATVALVLAVAAWRMPTRATGSSPPSRAGASGNAAAPRIAHPAGSAASGSRAQRREAARTSASRSHQIRRPSPDAPPVRLVDGRPKRPVRILVVGDSTAKSTGHGISEWSHRNPDLARVTIAGAPGCGLVPGGARVFVEGEQPIPPGCDHYLAEEVPAAVRWVRPDIVLVMSSWEVFDRRWHGGPVLTPFDSQYELRTLGALRHLVGSIRSAGAPRVSLVLEPVTDPYWRLRYSLQEDPRRHLPLHTVMQELARRDPTHVRLADVAGWLDRIGRVHDRNLRPDGVHWSWTGTQFLAGSYLAPLLVQQATT
jgi:hypothetical protein